jgi:hypothetical protein
MVFKGLNRIRSTVVFIVGVVVLILLTFFFSGLNKKSKGDYVEPVLSARVIRRNAVRESKIRERDMLALSQKIGIARYNKLGVGDTIGVTTNTVFTGFKNFERVYLTTIRKYLK